MIDRRGFIGLLMGTAIAPKSVLEGLVTPAPVKEAMKVMYIKWSPEDTAQAILESVKSGQLLAFEVEIHVEGGSEADWAARQGPPSGVTV